MQFEDTEVDGEKGDLEAAGDNPSKVKGEENLDEIMSYEDDAFSALIAQASQVEESGATTATEVQAHAESSEIDDELYQQLFLDLVNIEHQSQTKTGTFEPRDLTENESMDFTPG